MDGRVKEAFDRFFSIFRRGIKTSAEQPSKVITETITYTVAAGAIGIMPLNFKQIIGGPATFLRVVCNINCQVFFKNFDEADIEGVAEEKQDYEGLTGLIPRLYTNENISYFRVVPVALPATLTYYASRVPQEGRGS